VAAPHSRPGSPAHRESTVQLMAELYVHAQVAVERGYRRPLTLAMLARALAVSPRQLERACDEIGLTTFAAHLRAVRLRNAAELLAHQPLTVTDVARLVGYRQPSHFVKAFRRRFGTTPGAFRDAARRTAASTEATARARALRPPARVRPDTMTAADRSLSRSAHPYARRTRSSGGAEAPARAYSKPNSVDALRPDPDGRSRESDDAALGDCDPTPAARAAKPDDEDDTAASFVPPAPSKPNSPLA
jgi:AraC-like DNA-binding protein